MSDLKWIRIGFLTAESLEYQMLILERGNKEFYFFANAFFYIMGHDEPHKVTSLLEKSKRHTFPSIGGIFLNESTVREYISDYKTVGTPNLRTRIKNFEIWFEKFVTECKGPNPLIECPY